MEPWRVVVVGGGIFGATAALELSRRNHAVTLLDPGPVPHPLAASTDISKVVRMEYGADVGYMALGERALAGWRAWNHTLGQTLFHETGVLFVRRTQMEPGTFEHDSLDLLRRRGHPAERLGGQALAARFPAWNGRAYPDGLHHQAGGYVESGRVVTALLAACMAAGVQVHQGVTFHDVHTVGGRTVGVTLTDGSTMAADHVVLAMGAWTPHRVPALAHAFRSVGQPVFHLAPADPRLFMAARFPVFGADIAGTGWYGFPFDPVYGVVKVANHGAGRAMHPESPDRVVGTDDLARLRAFLAETFPALADAPVVHTRVCLYCDTADGHFWIDRDPERHGVTVAAGGSGHAFKFAPLLGDLIADAVEGRDNPDLARFRWRPFNAGTVHQEAARASGQVSQESTDPGLGTSPSAPRPSHPARQGRP